MILGVWGHWEGLGAQEDPRVMNWGDWEGHSMGLQGFGGVRGIPRDFGGSQGVEGSPGRFWGPTNRSLQEKSFFFRPGAQFGGRPAASGGK